MESQVLTRVSELVCARDIGVRVAISTATGRGGRGSRSHAARVVTRATIRGQPRAGVTIDGNRPKPDALHRPFSSASPSVMVGGTLSGNRAAPKSSNGSGGEVGARESAV